LGSSERGLSVYLHVPFCADKCLYCDFYSVPRDSVSRALQEKVVDETIRQAKALLALAPAEPIRTVFFGGGTPSALPLDLLRRLLAVFQGMSGDEWTLEANPESIDEAFLDLCASAGVTRLSIGVQTLDDGQLRLLRRPATRAETLACLELVARRWRGELSVDYIAGIPGQASRQVAEDIALLRGFGPRHFSLYQLTMEEGTPLAGLVSAGRLAMNPPELDEELWFAGKEALEGAGFRHYEVSNFCQPGKECLHNVRYWLMEPYLGVGPAAVSTLPAEPFRTIAPGVRGTVLRLSNPRDIHAFTEKPRWGMEAEEVGPREFLLEVLMMGLRLADGIPRALFAGRFGASVEELLPGLWEGWVGQGMAEPGGSSLRLTERGRLVLDGLLSVAAERIQGIPEGQLALRWPY
jgi:oxygen-independent coproporphyrinogen III oxidase